MKLRRLALAALPLLAACTPSQIATWVEWHQQDPEAAVEFANRPEVQAQLRASLVEALTGADGVGVAGDCDSYADDIAAAGLPSRFVSIAWRESGCSHTRFTDDRDDLGGFLLGLNFRTANLRAGWLRWCGATVSSIRYDLPLQLRCARAAYDRLGMSPWS
jgi:hypothetical protein